MYATTSIFMHANMHEYVGVYIYMCVGKHSQTYKFKCVHALYMYTFMYISMEVRVHL